MAVLLDELRHYYGVGLRGFGKTGQSPYGKVDMLALLIEPQKRERANGCIFFVGGHYPFQEAGSETVYHFLCNLLEEREDGSPEAERLLDRTCVVGIPQVNSNWYNSRFLEDRRRGISVHLENVYKEVCDITDYNEDYLKFLQEIRGRLPRGLRGSSPQYINEEVLNMKKFVSRIKEEMPVKFSFDFHESDNISGYLINEYVTLEIKGLPFAFQIPDENTLSVVERRYPVLQGRGPKGLSRLLSKETLEKNDGELAKYHLHQRWYFSTYMRLIGARSFLSETPGKWPLGDRIEMNLLAVDNILKSITPPQR